MKIVCEIPIDENGPQAVKELLECLARIWARRLARFPLARLYSTGIRYQIEPNAGRYEDWKSPPATFESGWGDCDDLVLYRVAELRAQGENATVQVMTVRMRAGTKMHVRVRRADGRIEDPSILAGAKAQRVSLR